MFLFFLCLTKKSDHCVVVCLFVLLHVLNFKYLLYSLLQVCQELYTLKCLSIGTPKAINFPFVSNEKLMFLGVPVFKHIVMRL